MSTELKIYSLTGTASLLLHLLVFGGAHTLSQHAPQAQSEIVEFALITPEPEPEPPETPEEPPAPKKPPPPKKPKLRKQKKPQKKKLPPPPNQAGKEAPKKARPVFGLTLESTTGPRKGTTQIRVGNTLMKDPEEAFTPPDEVQSYRGVPIHQVDKIPKVKREIKVPYPPLARKLKIEGVVLLEVEVRVDGTVGQVYLVKGLGHGLDQAAIEALKKTLFEPALKSGTPVPYIIPKYSYIWFLDD